MGKRICLFSRPIFFLWEGNLGNTEGKNLYCNNDFLVSSFKVGNQHETGVWGSCLLDVPSEGGRITKDLHDLTLPSMLGLGQLKKEWNEDQNSERACLTRGGRTERRDVRVCLCLTWTPRDRWLNREREGCFVAFSEAVYRPRDLLVRYYDNCFLPFQTAHLYTKETAIGEASLK